MKVQEKLITLIQPLTGYGFKRIEATIDVLFWLHDDKSIKVKEANVQGLPQLDPMLNYDQLRCRVEQELKLAGELK